MRKTERVFLKTTAIRNWAGLRRQPAIKKGRFPGRLTFSGQLAIKTGVYPGRLDDLRRCYPLCRAGRKPEACKVFLGEDSPLKTFKLRTSLRPGLLFSRRPGQNAPRPPAGRRNQPRGATGHTVKAGSRDAPRKEAPRVARCPDAFWPCKPSDISFVDPLWWIIRNLHCFRQSLCFL